MELMDFMELVENGNEMTCKSDKFHTFHTFHKIYEKFPVLAKLDYCLACINARFSME